MSIDQYLLTKDEYHRMLDAGVLDDPARVEMIDGLLVEKIGKNGPHCVCLDLLRDILLAILPTGRILRLQDPIDTDLGEPEPDAAIVQGSPRDFLSTHPRPDQIAVVIEVADATLERDRTMKLETYARNLIPEYWIVNLIDSQIEVYTDPHSGDLPAYAARRVFTPRAEPDSDLGGPRNRTDPSFKCSSIRNCR